MVCPGSGETSPGWYEAIQINMGMAVMKEVGAKWLTALYDKFRRPANGFKNVGIVEAVNKAREGPLPDEGSGSLPQVDEDPFNNYSEAEDC